MHKRGEEEREKERRRGYALVRKGQIMRRRKGHNKKIND